MEKSNTKTEEYRSLINYLQGKPQVRAGFTTTEGEAIISEELLQPLIQSAKKVDLTKYVNLVPVTKGSGKYPFIKNTESVLMAVSELAENPVLPQPELIEIDFNVETYRGALPISRELAEDAGEDIAQIVIDNSKQADINTKNVKIETLFKTATAKAITGLDGLTTLLNTGFSSGHDVKLFLSATLFDNLDKKKDTTGKYFVFDRDSSIQSGISFKGHEVIKLDDTDIGTVEGNLVGFVGDPRQFATLFDRGLMTVKWNKEKPYGTPLLCSSRFDVKGADTEAGYYITYTE